MEPFTSPPPSTLFSSLSCMSRRGSSLTEMSPSFCALCVVFPFSSPSCRFSLNIPAACRAACCPVFAAIRISRNVFHCPQLGHFPIHLVDSCPQFEQTYAVLSFAIELVVMLASCRVDVLSYVFRRAEVSYLAFLAVGLACCAGVSAVQQEPVVCL